MSSNITASTRIQISGAHQCYACLLYSLYKKKEFSDDCFFAAKIIWQNLRNKRAPVVFVSSILILPMHAVLQQQYYACGIIMFCLPLLYSFSSPVKWKMLHALLFKCGSEFCLFSLDNYTNSLNWKFRSNTSARQRSFWLQLFGTLCFEPRCDERTNVCLHLIFIQRLHERVFEIVFRYIKKRQSTSFLGRSW